MSTVRDYQLLLSYFLDALKGGDLAEEYLPEHPQIAQEIRFISNYLDMRLKYIHNVERSSEFVDYIRRFFDESNGE